MQHYDVFATVYESGTELLHGRHRSEAIDLLRLQPGHSVLDVATGTGANLPLLIPRVGPEGTIVGVDASPGMLARARKKSSLANWENVHLIEADARRLDAEMAGLDGFDAAICMLGLSVIPDWSHVFERMFELVRPGGRVVVMDLYLDGRPTSGIANTYYRFLAQADSRRRFWEPLERAADHLEIIDHRWFGGVARIAAGSKPVDLVGGEQAERPNSQVSDSPFR